MSDSILGEYNFTNNTIINILKRDEDEINYTILHETIHLMLTTQTRWGMACYLIRRIGVYDKSYSKILDYLCIHSRWVQESAAMFAECTLKFKNDGYDELVRYIEYIKVNNKKYYTYIVPMIKFINFLKPTSNIKTNVEILCQLILALAMASLNSDITEIKIETLQKNKMFKKFISDYKNVKKYIPNRRFKILLNESYNIIMEDEEVDLYNLIDKVIYSIEQKEDIKLKKEYFYKTLNVDEYYEYLLKLKEYCKLIYSSSKRLNEINIFLESVNVKEIEDTELAQYSIPSSFSSFDIVNKSYNEILGFFNNKLGILFYLEDLQSLDVFDTSLMYISPEEINKIKNKVNGKNHVLIFLDYIEKKSIPMNISKNEVENIIDLSKVPVVVNYKRYDKLKDDILGIETNNKKIIIYCDRAYPNSVEVINNICSSKSKARIMDYSSMKVLIIKISDKTRFILPFVNIAYSQVMTDIKSGRINIELADNPDGITTTDPYIFVEEDVIEEYNLIINCLFETK